MVIYLHGKGNMFTILIVFSSTDGHTLKICNRLKARIDDDENQVTVCSVDDAPRLDLRSFDKIVIGASIRYGKHHQRVYDFIESHLALLGSKPNAFFTVNIVARKANKNQPENNPYLLKFLRQIAWRPRELAVFAGKLDYPKYGFLDRLMIRLIMKITKGPTDPTAVIEFTDWEQVDDFALRLRRM